MFHVLKRIRNLRRLSSSQADVAFFCWIQKITAERFGAFVRKYYFCTRNTGCSSVRLEYASGGRVVAGSNPVTPTGFKGSKLLRQCATFLFLYISRTTLPKKFFVPLQLLTLCYSFCKLCHRLQKLASHTETKALTTFDNLPHKWKKTSKLLTAHHSNVLTR